LKYRSKDTLKLPVYLLPVSGIDVVLGATWLATLGFHIANYSDLTLKFLVDGNFIILYGDKPKLSATAQYNHLRILVGRKGLTPSLNFIH